MSRSFPSRSMSLVLRDLLRATLLLVFIAGCGGGGVDGGVDSGGTGAAVLSLGSGPITGFGSVIVGGVHYDDASASVLDADGNAHSRDDLKLGMTTEIQGSAVVTDTNGSSSVATRIVYGSSVLGPIASIAVSTTDTTSGTLLILGQTVSVNPTTVFDESLAGGLASLSVGDVVEVYALAGGTPGAYVATRIERRAVASNAASVATFVLRSVVTQVDANAKTFVLGGLTVSSAGVPGGDAIANPVVGAVLRVQLQRAPIAGIWQAVRVKNGGIDIGNVQQARVEGLVTAFTSSTQFSVEGVSIDASAAQFPDGTSGLQSGARVSIEGTVQGTTLKATKVDVKSETQIAEEGFEIDGSIASIDTAHQTFVVRGVVIDYSGSVDFRDGTVADLATGRVVQVQGSLTAGGTLVHASRIRFR